jgi:nucleoside 2-deoxyribosyltransferase
VVIIIGGFEGTYRAANWARIDKRPILPVTAFGGAAAKVYEGEFDAFDEKYAMRIEKLEYEELNSAKTDWPKRAERVVALAEKISTSKLVPVIMSYSKSGELDDAYDSFRAVCEDSKLGYICERVEDANTVDRIVPKILAQIAHAAFVIADLTELKTNVFFELGYAQGLRKPVIVTAKKGTELPFDVKDIPTIFWESQRQLKEALKVKVLLIAKTQGRG